MSLFILAGCLALCNLRGARNDSLILGHVTWSRDLYEGINTRKKPNTES